MMKSCFVVVMGICCLTASAIAGDAWFGVFGGPRFNSAAGTAIDALKDGGGKVTSSSGMGVGAYVALPMSTQVKLNLGAGYSQRGYGMESSYIVPQESYVQASDMSSVVAANYLDLMVGLAWYFMAADSGSLNLQPYLGADLIPGFFLSGKSTTTSFGNESSQDITSDDIKTLNMAFRPNAGVDFFLSPEMLIGANIGYELGLTNTAKSMYEGETGTPAIKFNSLILAVRLAFAM